MLFMEILNQHWCVSHILISGRLHLYEHMDKVINFYHE